MLLNKELELKLKKAVLIHLEQGREGWDVPHTLNAVEWMRKLIAAEGGDEKILVTVMYLHDIGYPSLKKGYDFGEVEKVKAQHAEFGAKKAREILKNLGAYSEAEIEKISFLIKSHDDLEIDRDHDMQLVFEADNLGKLDWENIIPTFDQSNRSKFLEHYKSVRVPLFKTKTSKRFLRALLPKAEAFI